MKHAFKATLIVAILCLCPAARAAAPSEGKKVFDRWCSSCHAPGPRMPGTAALAAKYGGAQPAALEERRNLTPDLVKYFVRHGVSIMPSFRKTEITDTELDALAAYLAPKRKRAEK